MEGMFMEMVENHQEEIRRQVRNQYLITRFVNKRKIDFSSLSGIFTGIVSFIASLF